MRLAVRDVPDPAFADRAPLGECTSRPQDGMRAIEEETCAAEVQHGEKGRI